MSLFELFSGDTWKFDIPDYQRPYSWRPKQVRWDGMLLLTLWRRCAEFEAGLFIHPHNPGGNPAAAEVVDAG